MTAHVWRTGERVFLPDVASNTTVSRALLRINAAVSSLWQPVILRDQVTAVIGVGWDRMVEDPGDRAIRVVQVIADEVGVSLQASRLHRELELMASTDPLTGLLNRRAWDDALTRLMNQAELNGEPLAVAVLDVDHFKAYNDRYGHMAGDARLAEFAPAARQCLRKDDIFARWGGEEFVVALPGCAPAQAHIILERIRAAIPAGLTCSIGHTTWIPGEDLDDCIGRADEALYTAKQAGRDRLMSA
jgi:diguanylate cyclase (GGDEF)-like protein